MKPTTTSLSKPTITRILVAGLAAGAAFSLTAFLTFGLIGSGLDHRSGFLFSAHGQSPKLIAVWTTLPPLPLAVRFPPALLAGYFVFAIGHAFIYSAVAASWPSSRRGRTLRMAGLIWFCSALFFEFVGPFNLFAEPPRLGLVELGFWALIMLAEATALTAVLERPALVPRPISDDS
jgi:hypothetical protein